MEGNRKHILDRFQDHLHRGYLNWCEKHGILKSGDRLISYIIDQDLIPASRIQRYTIKKEFEKIMMDRQLNKTQAVRVLADIFNISERTVWNILRSKRDGNGKYY